MPEAVPRGRFVWHELMTTDPDSAEVFYKKIVGWGVQSWEHDPTYRLWTMGVAPMGGLMPLPEDARRMGTPPYWLAYVAVPDVDATVRQATSLGARIYVEPRDIPVGRFAVLADPQGATFALYKPAVGQPPPSDGAGLADFSWHELVTTNWRAAWDFYHALFGWEKTEAMDMGEAGVYQMYRRAGGGPTLGGMYDKSAEMPGPPYWLCYVTVPSADKGAATVKRLGGRVIYGPADVPGGGRIAQCLDPQGAMFALHSMAAAPARSARKTTKAAKRTKRTVKSPKRTVKKATAKGRGGGGRGAKKRRRR